MTRKSEYKKLLAYKHNLEYPRTPFPEGYLEDHKKRIEWLDWLIGSYEGRAGNPKILLESLLSLNPTTYYTNYKIEMETHFITPINEIDMLKDLVAHIGFLYQWVYYKKITGF